MKLSQTLFFPLLLVSALTPALAAPATTPSDPVSRLADLRAQLERYETPIIHAYLSRAALGGSTPLETALTTDILSDLLRRHARLQPEIAVERWLRSTNATMFNDLIPFPPGTAFVTPVVLARDAVLDQPVVGKGVFPVGRRPQDPATIERFFHHTLTNLPRSASLDPPAAALLVATLLHLTSARILLGYQVAQAKFDWQHDTFCHILTTQPHPNKAILEIIVDNKQQVIVLGRVQEKAKALSQLWTKDPPYPERTQHDVLRLFQAYLVPITTAVELQAIQDQAGRCKNHA